MSAWCVCRRRPGFEWQLAQLLDLLAGHDRLNVALHRLFQLGECQAQGGQLILPLGFVVFVFFRAAASAAAAVMPNTADVLMGLSSLSACDLRLGLTAMSHAWVQLDALARQQAGDLSIQVELNLPHLTGLADLAS